MASLKIHRTADVIFSFLIIFLVVIVFYIFIVVKKNQKNVEEIVRKIALKKSAVNRNSLIINKNQSD